MIFAVGQNTLGYNNSELEKSITKTIKYGNMTSLNCPEEVSLAEKLIFSINSSDKMNFYSKNLITKLIDD